MVVGLLYSLTFWEGAVCLLLIVRVMPLWECSSSCDIITSPMSPVNVYSVQLFCVAL